MGRRALTGPAVLVVALVLAGCTGPDDEPAPTATSAPRVTASSSGPTTSATTAGPTQTPDARPAACTEPPEVQTGGQEGRATAHVEVSTVATDLAVPWGMAPLSDGRVVLTLRDDADVVLVDPDGTVTPVEGPGADALADAVVHEAESGLLGVTVLAERDDEVDLALYATTAQDNRVLRATLSGTTLGDLTPVLTGIPRQWYHSGGGVALGPDGCLWITTGDAGDPDAAQDLDSLGGKILRVTPDGDPAPGNPFDGSPVWSYGHRNVQGIGWSADGRTFASEFGQDTWDELNVIHPGGNYGWPVVEGRAGDGDFVEPVAVWATDDASPSGLAVTDEAVYLAGLRGQTLWRVPLRPAGERDSDGVGEPQALLTGEHGRLRAVVAVGGSGLGSGSDEGAATGGERVLLVLTNNRDGRGDPTDGDDRLLRVVVD
jgi:glucose/arabinose dehydrogenase